MGKALLVFCVVIIVGNGGRAEEPEQPSDDARIKVLREKLADQERKLKELQERTLADLNRPEDIARQKDEKAFQEELRKINSRFYNEKTGTRYLFNYGYNNSRYHYRHQYEPLAPATPSSESSPPPTPPPATPENGRLSPAPDFSPLPADPQPTAP